MFDIGWTELLLIAVVALIVIGPKDLPVMFQTLGRFTGRMRSMAREFQGAMEQAARESGVKDAANDLKSLTSAKSLGIDKVREAADRFEKWDPLTPKQTTLPQTPAQVPPASTAPVSAPVSAAPAPSPEGPATAALRQSVEARKSAAMAPATTAPSSATTMGTAPADPRPPAAAQHPSLAPNDPPKDPPKDLPA